MKTNKTHMDPMIAGLINAYQVCRLGTGGMGFNWPDGTWQDSPKIMVEAFQIIDNAIAEHSARQQEIARQTQRMPFQ